MKIIHGCLFIVIAVTIGPVFWFEGKTYERYNNVGFY